MSPKNKPILPGAIIGIFGGGQLGRMSALAARSMGYHVHIYSDVPGCPADAIADKTWIGAYNDVDQVTAFAKAVDVATFEFENVSSVAADTAGKHCPVRPNGQVLHIAQNRLREKTFLKESGIPVAPFSRIESLEDLKEAISRQGTPGVLKTAGFGYDGKGQQKMDGTVDPDDAWASFEGQQAVYESFIDFTKEISVVGARTPDGRFKAFPVLENTHANHILDVSFAPAAVSPAVSAQAVELTEKIMKDLDAVGLLTVEMFLTADDRVIVNEMAPRPHNSGHLTMNGCVTSQFEQHIRAVCNLPLGETDVLCPCAMANVLGDWWFADESDQSTEPAWAAALSIPETFLHLYGKTEARRKRKMGHINALGPSTKDAVQRAVEARSRLR